MYKLAVKEICLSEEIYRLFALVTISVLYEVFSRPIVFTIRLLLELVLIIVVDFKSKLTNIVWHATLQKVWSQRKCETDSMT